MPDNNKKKSVQEFAQSIKTKYPQYKDVEDNELVSKIIKKYPSYAEKVDFSEEMASKDEEKIDLYAPGTKPSEEQIQQPEEGLESEEALGVLPMNETELRIKMLRDKQADIEENSLYEANRQKGMDNIQATIVAKAQKEKSEEYLLKKEEEDKAQAELDKKIAKKPIIDKIGSYAATFDQSILGLPGEMMKAAGIMSTGIANKIGFEDVKTEDDILFKIGEYWSNKTKELFPSDPDLQNEVPTMVSKALGDLMGMYGGGLAGQLSKATGVTVKQSAKGLVKELAKKTGQTLKDPGTAIGAVQMSVPEFEQAIADGATDEQAFEVFMKNAVTGSVLERLPIQNFLKRFNDSTKGGLVNVLKRGTVGGLEEGVTEVIQGMYANKTANEVYGATRDILEGTTEGGAIGFGLGFIINSLGGRLRAVKENYKGEDISKIDEAISLVEQKKKELEEEIKKIDETDETVSEVDEKEEVAKKETSASKQDTGKENLEEPREDLADPINDEEFNDFVDKGSVKEETLNNIADKIKNGETLSEREKAIHADKTADVEEILKKEPTVKEDIDSKSKEIDEILAKESIKSADLDRISQLESEIESANKDVVDKVDKANPEISQEIESLNKEKEGLYKVEKTELQDGSEVTIRDERFNRDNTFVYDKGVWKQNVGGDLVAISNNRQSNLTNEFNKKNIVEGDLSGIELQKIGQREAEIDSRISQLTKERNSKINQELTKTKKDAVPEQTPDEVDVQPEAESSKEVGEKLQTEKPSDTSVKREQTQVQEQPKASEKSSTVSEEKVKPKTKEDARRILKEKFSKKKKAKEPKVDKKGETKITWKKRKPGKPDSKITKRVDAVQESVEKLARGEITNEQYQEVLEANTERGDITDITEPATKEEVTNAVNVGKKNQVDLKIDEGTEVGIRPDIPSFFNRGTWVNTVHGKGTSGKVVSHEGATKVKNPKFFSSPKASLEIATKKKWGKDQKPQVWKEDKFNKQGKLIHKKGDIKVADKTPSAGRIMGEYTSFKGDTHDNRMQSAKTEIEQVANDPSWTQVSFNPFRGSMYFERSTGRPIKGGSEAIVMGSLVYVKDPQYTTKEDAQYEVEGFKDAEGKPVKFKKGEEVSREGDRDSVESIVNDMNQMEMHNADIDLTENTTNETIDVDALNEGLDTSLETIDISDYDGVPMNFTISDQLRSSEVVNPNTGNKISNLNGGIGFNGTKGNQGNAWANTDEKTAQSMLDDAVKLYNNNKQLFESLWNEGRLPKGQIPLAVVKMGADSIKSNEALIRVAIDNIKTNIPLSNRKNALKEFKKSFKEKIAKKTKFLETGKGAKGNKLAENSIKVLKKEVATMKKVMDFIENKNITDVAVLLENVTEFKIGERPMITNEVLYGNFAEKKTDKVGKPNTPVSKALIEGLGEEAGAYINFKNLGDIVEEKAISKIPKEHIIGLVGVDVLNPKITKPNHPNYPYGVKGGSIGILKKPVHMADVFGEAYSNAVTQVAKTEAKGKSITKVTALSQGVPVQSGLVNKVFRGATLSSKLNAVDKLNGFLRQAFPNVQFFNDKASWDTAINDPNVKKHLKDGEVVYGFTEDGKIFLNPEVSTSKVALHEVGHIWMDFMKENRPDIHQKGLDLVEGTREYELAKEQYGDTDLAKEEALMELMSTKGETIVDAAQKAKFKEWLLSLWNYVKNSFTSLKDMNPKQIENITIDKFVEGMLADVLSGKALTSKDFKSKAPRFSKLSEDIKSAVEYIENLQDYGFLGETSSSELHDDLQEMGLDVDVKTVDALRNAALGIEEKAPVTRKKAFAETIIEEPSKRKIGKPIKKGVEKEAKYTVKKMTTTELEAEQIMKDLDVEEAYDFFLDPKSDMAEDVRVVLGQKLILKHNDLARKAETSKEKRRMHDKAITVANNLADLHLRMGRANNAAKIYFSLSPEGQLLAIQKAVGKKRSDAFKKDSEYISSLEEIVNKANADVIEQVIKSPKVKKAIEAMYGKASRREGGSSNKSNKRKKRIVNQAIDFLESIKIDTSGKAYDATFAIPASIYNGAISTLQAALKAGIKISEAIEKTSAWVNDNYKGAWDEEGFKKDLTWKMKRFTALEKVNDADYAGGVRVGLNALNTSINEVVRKHYTEQNKTKKELVDKFIDELGLTEPEASAVAREIEKAFNDLATKNKKQQLNKLLSPKTLIDPKKRKAKKELQEEIIEMSNMGALDNETIRQSYAEKMGLPTITDTQADEIMRLADIAQQAKGDIAKNKAEKDLLSYQRKISLGEKGWMNVNWGNTADIATSLWYANMLSGVTTQTLNVWANAVETTGELAVSTVQDPRNFGVLLQGLLKGYGKAIPEVKAILTSKYGSVKGSKIEIPNILEDVKFKGVSVKGKEIIPNPYNLAKYVGRVMDAADTFFYTGLKEMRYHQLAALKAREAKKDDPTLRINKEVSEILHNNKEQISEATQQAINEGYNEGTNSFKRRVNEIVEENRDVDWAEDARDFASRGTFNYDPEGTMGLISNNINALIQQVPPLRAVIPFTRILANVTNRYMDWIPVVGGVRVMKGGIGWGKNKREFTPEERKRVFIKAVGGTLAIMSLFSLDDGEDDGEFEITADGYSDFKKNYELSDAKGWQEYSVRIGDKWYSYKNTPLAVGMAIVGYARDAKRYHGKSDDSVDWSSSMMGMIQYTMSFSFMQGVADFMSIFSKGASQSDAASMGKLEKFFVRTSKTMMIPNLFNQSHRLYLESTDQPMRKADVWYQEYYKDIPYFNDNMSKIYNSLGEEVVPDMSNRLIPFNIKRAEKDKIYNLLQKNGVFIGAPSRTIYIDGVQQKLENRDYNNYGMKSGKLIKKMIEEDYEYLKELKGKEFEDEINKIKSYAREEVRYELFLKK